MSLIAGIITLAAPSTGDTSSLAKATFAGGCFWCMESPYDKLKGVVKTTSGYTDGNMDNPTYEEVTTGTTGHAEAVEVIYDPEIVTYEKLLYIFWRNVDPLVKNRQFCDIGSQYRTAIFYHDEQQKKAAEASREELNRSGRFKEPIVTEIVAASAFYSAEEYHQDYYRKNPMSYQIYRLGCGRDGRLRELWGDEAGAH